MSALPAELSFATVPAVLAQHQQLLASGVLDLAPVKSADSAGIALLLELTRRAKHAGKTLVLRNASTAIRSLSAFFGVDSVLTFE